MPKIAPAIIILTIVFVVLGTQPFARLDDTWLGLGLKTALAAAGLLILPVATIKYVFKKPLSVFGLGRPKNIKLALGLGAGLVAVNLPLLIIFAQQPDFQQHYRWPNNSVLFFLYAGLALSLIYYLAEEFIFRGFLFLGLWPSWSYHSFWITSVIFAVFHLTKPPAEILYSLGLSLALCFLTLKTKSAIPAGLTHFLIALILNILINYVYADKTIFLPKGFSF